MPSRHLQAWTRLDGLRNELRRIAERDPEQEVQGIALPVLDAVIADTKDIIGPDDPVVASLVDVVSPEIIQAGEPVRAVDALLAVDALISSLGTPPEMQPRAPRGFRTT